MARTNEEIARAVMAGEYGNVDTGRYERLQQDGYDPRVIQDIVNQMAAGTYTGTGTDTEGDGTKVDTGLRDTSSTSSTTGQYGTFQYGKMPTYISKYQTELDNWKDKLLNFNYNPNEDASYLNYKDQYINNGQRAMQDTMAKAAAMTGGYGSSYGQSVGQQTYQDYMTALTDKIPELSQAAYNLVANNFNTLNTLDQNDYARWQDEYDAYMNAYEQAEYLRQLAEASSGSGSGGGGGYYNSGNSNSSSSVWDYVSNAGGDWLSQHSGTGNSWQDNYTPPSKTPTDKPVTGAGSSASSSSNVGQSLRDWILGKYK